MLSGCQGDGFARKRDSNKQTKTNHPKGMARIETEDRIKLLNWPVPAANREGARLIRNEGHPIRQIGRSTGPGFDIVRKQPVR